VIHDEIEKQPAQFNDRSHRVRLFALLLIARLAWPGGMGDLRDGLLYAGGVEAESVPSRVPRRKKFRLLCRKGSRSIERKRSVRVVEPRREFVELAREFPPRARICSVQIHSLFEERGDDARICREWPLPFASEWILTRLMKLVLFIDATVVRPKSTRVSLGRGRIREEHP
jgi:hypothetical protein